MLPTTSGLLQAEVLFSRRATVVAQTRNPQSPPASCWAGPIAGDQPLFFFFFSVFLPLLKNQYFKDVHEFEKKYCNLFINFWKMFLNNKKYSNFWKNIHDLKKIQVSKIFINLKTNVHEYKKQFTDLKKMFMDFFLWIC